jgi:hypothetical protein
MDQEERGPRSQSGMTGKRKAPRWVHPFLRALERCGEARAASADAGIDWSTAYARRRAHSDFAAAWAEALQVHKLRAARFDAEELEAFNRSLDASLDAPSPSQACGSGPSLSRTGRGTEGEEYSVANGQVRRVGHGRWSARKEKIFFDELAATANIRRSAAAAGVSYNAVQARRLKHPLFRAKWDAVAQSAKANIGMYLLEASQQTFDPERAGMPDATPKVTIAEAIRISESKGPKAQSPEAADPFSDESYDYHDDIAEIREGLVRKLQAMRRRERPELLARGWSFDESWDREIPPGWVKGPDWRPRTPDDIG